jgi:hypothetical protein
VAARGEVDPAAARAIGAALCRAQNRPATAEPAGDAGAERAQVEALAAEHPLPAMRAALLGELLGYGGPSWFEFTELRLGNDADGEVRRAALSAFMTADPARKDEVCGLWKRHADADPDPATAAVAARSLASWGHCR